VENVNSVVNESGRDGHSTLTQRSSDTLVTGRVKAMLVDARDLSSNAFKVVTERGTTYLMGRVTQREADRATEVVRSRPACRRSSGFLKSSAKKSWPACCRPNPPCRRRPAKPAGG
jgi:hypothetical protein